MRIKYIMDTSFQAQYTALKILKQRCEYLQQRLEYVEEENCQLKLQKISTDDKPNKKSSENNSLEKQIIVLENVNFKMLHEIQGIKTENKNLWSQLSRLMSGNDSLGVMLSVTGGPSAPCEKEKITKLEKTRETKPQSYNLDDYGKESLDDISIKLINGILKGKTELESQCSEMIDLTKENSLSKNFHSGIIPSHLDNGTALNDMRVSIQKLKDFKEVLFQQKIDLKNAIATVKNVSKNFSQKKCNLVNNSNSENQNVNTDINNLPASNILTLLSNNRSNEDNTSAPDKICPMCAKKFTGNFSEFFQHVNIHFEDGYEDLSTEFSV